ncbi:hypothetical protein ACMA46_14115 [Clavibacter sp. Sh2141]|uniref:hypothetical protein n=1 Tax=Clavibacter sp. Sh2141 TaxID=3395374 RepID=UPI0039BC3B55
MEEMMWIEANGELASEVFPHPVKLLPRRTAREGYAAPRKDRLQFLEVAMETESAKAEEAEELLGRGVVKGYPAQPMPMAYMHDFGGLGSWREAEEFMRSWCDTVPIEWQWDASLIVCDIGAELDSSMLRRSWARLVRNFVR